MSPPHHLPAAAALLTCRNALPPTPASHLQKYPITDVRGRGLMLAAELGSRQADGSPSLAAPAGVASKLTHAAARRGLLLMGAGAAACGRGRAAALCGRLRGLPICRATA